jgi:3-dehydroquinate dehydratase II
MKVLIVHGPGLDLLGTREPAVYGTLTLDEVNTRISAEADALDIDVDIRQTAREGEIIELLHSGVERLDGAILNPAAYSHTSRAIAEAIRAVPYPVIEVHLSNIHAREEWRRTSVTAEAAVAVVAGLGVGSYLAALRALKEIASS